MKTYRIYQEAPQLFTIQMETVSGWIGAGAASTTLAGAKELIRQRVEKDNFVPKYYGMDGSEISPD